MVSNLNSTDIDGEDYRTKYRRLKHRLKYLIYENENFQLILRQAQQKYLSAKRDRTFLLDRLIQYEQPNSVSSGSEPSESSEEEEKVIKQEPMKRKRSEGSSSSQQPAKKWKKVSAKSAAKQPSTASRKANIDNPSNMSAMLSEGQLTPEEVERHLQSRQSLMELLPCRAPPTVPSELFSNDPSLDSFCFSESNEMELETSPDIGDKSYGVDLSDVAD